MVDMDSSARRILAVLKAGAPTAFPELVLEVGFSQNTLRLHLARLEEESFILKEKSSQERELGGPGIPTACLKVLVDRQPAH